jgi:hypothetical protein
MPDCCGDLAVNTRVHFLPPYAHTRLRVRLAPGIPHALYFEGEGFLAQLGRNAPRGCEGVFDENERATFSVVVPANAGTHNHRHPLKQELLATAQKREAAAYGSRRLMRNCALGRDDVGSLS